MGNCRAQDGRSLSKGRWVESGGLVKFDLIRCEFSNSSTTSMSVTEVPSVSFVFFTDTFGKKALIRRSFPSNQTLRKK